MDPRVKTSAAALRQQHDLSVALYDAMLEARAVAAKLKQAGNAALAAELERAASSHTAVIDALQDADSAPTDVVVRTATERLAAWRVLQLKAKVAAP
jgi:hypothetical protein